MATLDECFEALGLTQDATPEQLKLAFRAAAKTLHPDMGGDPVKFSELNKKYMRAMDHATTPRKCTRCDGTGKFRQAHGFHTATVDCYVCKGSGKVKPR